jgi:outer membrane protein OmpA-like peptidoglycan-associated protein
MRASKVVLVLGAVMVLTTTSCSGSSGSSGSVATSPATMAATDTATDDTAPADTAPADALPADAAPTDTTPPDTATPDTSAVGEAGLDDVDGDGELDPTCGTVDLGGGLVARLLCTSMAPQNEDGVIPVDPGPLSLAGTSYPETDSVDATVRWGRGATGERITIFQLGSDTLFDAGSSTVRTTAEPALAGVAAAITANLSGGRIMVRGHADSRGSAADNQALSQARADAVATALAALGLDPSTITTIGLGSSVPAALETTADGAVSEIGQTLNRRVEIVVVQTP